MSSKHILVQGAKVQCSFSLEPKTDTLKVKSNDKESANDKDGSEKPIATTKDIGQTLEKNTFGKCKLQPNGSGDYLPCQCVIQQWSNPYKNITLSNKGKILTEDSKATCPIGGPDCITVKSHGQKNGGSKKQSRKKDNQKADAINPIGNSKAMKQEEEQQQGNLVE